MIRQIAKSNRSTAASLQLNRLAGLCKASLRSLSTTTTLTDEQQKELAQSVTKDVAVRQSLDTIVKDVDKLKALDQAQIDQLWTDYHKDKPFSLAGKSLQPTQWIKIKERATMAPFFVLPNVRAKNSFFVMLTEYKEDFALMTFLDDYRRIGSNANPWCSLSFFPELDSVVLVQTKFSPYLKREEALTLSNRWIQFYENDKLFEQSVFTFNKKPENFNFNLTFPETSA